VAAWNKGTDMRGRQRGVTLGGLLVAAVVVAIVAMLGIKIAPEYYEHRQILNAIHKVAAESDAATSVAQVRAAFDRQANVDYISAITGADLDVSKESGAIVIEFAYERRVPLFGNASLLLDFTGSSRK